MIFRPKSAQTIFLLLGHQSLIIILLMPPTIRHTFTPTGSSLEEGNGSSSMSVWRRWRGKLEADSQTLGGGCGSGKDVS
jgi:hypothetical protein